MAITCICPTCRKQLSIADEHAGQPMKCPMCQAMFQAPVQIAAQTGAAYSGPAPFWQTQPTSNPNAPEWPWLAGNKPAATGTGGDYDWEKVANPSMALDPSWHLVRRGLGLIPASLIVAFTAAAIGLIFWVLGGKGVEGVSAEASKVVLFMAIPIAAMGSIGALLGLGLCCAAPKEGNLKLLAIGAAIAAFVALIAGMFAVLLNARVPHLDAGFLRGLLSTLAYLGFALAVLATLAAGGAFLLFLRGTAESFGNKRLGQRIFYFLFAFAGSPVAALLIYLLFRGMAAIMGMDEGAYLLIVTFAELALVATVLGGLLLMVRDTRATLERVVVPTRA